MSNIIESLDFAITECDLSEMIPEINRFVLHIFLVHVVTYLIDGREIFTPTFFKTLLVTAIAIMAYHILLKKITNRKLKNIKYMCKKHKDNT